MSKIRLSIPRRLEYPDVRTSSFYEFETRKNKYFHFKRKEVSSKHRDVSNKGWTSVHYLPSVLRLLKKSCTTVGTRKERELPHPTTIEINTGLNTTFTRDSVSRVPRDDHVLWITYYCPV